MKTFDSPMAFSDHLLKLKLKEELALAEGLKTVVKLVEKTAKDEFGVYQGAVGNFPAWPELADSTKKDRVRKGFSENEPLLRTGELRDSVKSEVKSLEGVVGSYSDIMVYQELGTDKIPARPALGPAVFRNKDKIQKIVGAAAVTGILGGSKIDPRLGYDFVTDVKD